MQFGRAYVQGTERYLSMLGTCLRERGHEVIYLAGDPLRLGSPASLGQRISEDPPILAYPTRGWMAVAGEPEEKLDRLLTELQPDLVHVANPAHIGAGIISRCVVSRIPTVVTTMDFWWVCPKATLLRPDHSICDGKPEYADCFRCIAASKPGRTLRWAARCASWLGVSHARLFLARGLRQGLTLTDCSQWVNRRENLGRLLEAADYVIFPSRATHDAIRPHLSHQRFTILPYGLSNDWFLNPRPPRTEILRPEEMVIGFAGVLAPHKGPHVLLKALQRLGWSRTRVRLAGPVGDRHYERELRELSNGLNVEFVGALGAEAMPGFLRGLDLLAMPSLWLENLPFVMLEAQAAGVPVVGSRLPGIAEQIGDERLLFDPGSAEGLAAALAWVRESPGRHASRPVMTVEQMTDLTERVYKSAMARNQETCFASTS